MTSIDTASRLAALLQAQSIAGIRRKANGATPDANEKADRNQVHGSPNEGTGNGVLGQVSPEILTQIRQLSCTDSSLPRQAFRVFLRGNLSQQLRPGDSNDSSFEQLVDEVLGMMERDGDLREAVQLAGQRLVSLALHR